MKRIYVVGHKNPDTDSIASTIALAELKNALGVEVIPKRLGSLNEETKFATKYFDVEAPDVMYDARTKLGDIDLDEPITISQNASCNDAFKSISKSSTKTLFAVENDKLLGVVSISDLTSIRLMNKSEREELLSKSSIDVIANDINGEILNKTNYDTNGKIVIYNDNTNIEKCIVVVDSLDNFNKAINKNPSVIIYVGTLKDKSIKSNDISLIQTNMSMEDVVITLTEAIPVSLVMTKDYVSYNANEYVEDIASKIISTRYRSYPVVTDDGKLLGSVSRYHLLNYKKNSFILVDHSSTNQSIDNIDRADVIEIVDHHNIGDIQTIMPINYRNQTCGCTCSIIYQMFKENNIKPTKKAAGMMLSAIISDTLYFISNTTTVLDINAANELAKLAEVDLNDYARKLLAASVNLNDVDIEDLIERDLKYYDLFGNKVAIASTNYNKMSEIQPRLNEFKDKLQEYQKAKNLDLLIMMFTSVRADGTMFIFFGQKSNVMLNILETTFDNNSGFDTTILSRKQELVPKLSKALQV